MTTNHLFIRITIWFWMFDFNLSTSNNHNGLFHPLFWNELKLFVGVKGLSAYLDSAVTPTTWGFFVAINSFNFFKSASWKIKYEMIEILIMSGWLFLLIRLNLLYFLFWWCLFINYCFMPEITNDRLNKVFYISLIIPLPLFLMVSTPFYVTWCLATGWNLSRYHRHLLMHRSHLYLWNRRMYLS